MRITSKIIFQTILSLAVMITLSSCLKKQNLSESDLGPAINTESLQNKMGSSIGALSYDQIRKHEINVFTAVSRIQEGSSQSRYKQELYVSDIISEPEQTTIQFLFNRMDYLNSENSVNGGAFKLIITNERSSSHLSLKTLSDSFPALTRDALKINASTNISEKAEKPGPLFLYRAYLYFAIQGCKEPQVSCHNLKTSERKIYLKPSQASTLICPDINNCMIDENQIEFDMLDASIKTDDGKPYRTHYTFTVSPQLPFLSKVIRYCARGLTKINDRMVLAEDCSYLEDFSYGQ
jgi:hypothetical protein